MSSIVECLFGYHNYIIPWEENKDVLICENCKRVGYRKYSDGYERWYDFDEKGNEIHCRTSYGNESWYDEEGNMMRYRDFNGYEEWYDEKGNEIHRKNSNGYERWYDGKEWVSKKPKNWKYENV